MAKNDIFYKILFAIQLALIPIVFFASLIIKIEWVTGLLLFAILICKIWIEVFKDKASKEHNIINSIGSVISLSSLLIFFSCTKVILSSVAVVTILFVLAANIMKIVMFNKHMPEMIEAVDFCYMLFECILIVALAFAGVSMIITNVSMVAVIITSVVSVGYKVYFAFKYTDLWSKIKKIFTRK